MATPLGGFDDSAKTLHGESFGEVGLTVAAVGGSMVGAVAGAWLGAEFGSAFPLLCGTLGTMLGSGLAAGAWYLLARLLSRLFAKATTHQDNAHAGESHEEDTHEDGPVPSANGDVGVEPDTAPWNRVGVNSSRTRSP